MKQRHRVLVLATWLRPAMAQGLARFARKANWHLLLGNTLSDDFDRNTRCDGTLLFHTERPEARLFARRQARQAPAVLVSGMKPIVEAPTVMEDNVGIGRMAAAHFLERGFQHFAWLATDSRRVGQDRRAGFLAALQEAGMSCQCLEWLKPVGPQWQRYSRWLARSLGKLPRPLALFAQDDLVAVDAIEICRDNGLRVPDDVAVLGVGNDPLICEFSAVPLSSIELDWTEIVYRAAELLDGLMSARPPREGPLIFPPRTVVLRTSTDVLASSNAYLTEALRFIRDHFRDPILVRDVARAVGVTRRTLENHFRQHLHYGVADALRRRRVACAQELLANTALTMAEIAGQSGFDSAISLSRIFKRVRGMHPSRYRQQQQRRDSRSKGKRAR
jgi:LacI family transcriptional regulator